MNENIIEKATEDTIDTIEQVVDAIPVEADRKNIALGVGAAGIAVAAVAAGVTVLIRCCIRKKQKNDQDLTANTGVDNVQAAEDDFEDCDSTEE